MFGLQHPLTCKPWTTLLNPCNKVRGKYMLKKSSGVFLHASLSLCRCELFYIYMCTYVDVNLHMWLYNIKKKPTMSIRKHSNELKVHKKTVWRIFKQDLITGHNPLDFAICGVIENKTKTASHPNIGSLSKRNVIKCLKDILKHANCFESVLIQ